MNKILNRRNHVSHFEKDFLIKAMTLKKRMKAALEDTSGQQLTEHAGWIVVIILIVLAAVAYAIPQVRTTLLPALFSRIMNMINFTG